MKTLFKTIQLQNFSAMLGVKAWRPLVAPILRMVTIMGGRLSPSWCKLTVILLADLALIYKHQGAHGIVKFLKVAHVTLQQSISGHCLIDCTELGVRISRTNTGLPRVIPFYHRNLIRRGNILVIRYYMTVFWLYRIIILPCKMKLETITSPRKVDPKLEVQLYKLINNFNRLFAPSLYKLADRLMAVQFRRPFPILKSSPQSADQQFSTHPITLVKSAWALVNDSVYPSWYLLSHLMGASDLRWMINEVILEGKIQLKTPFIGRLGLKEEAAGKMRVFAMVDPWTQWLLFPLHRCIFRILRKIPMDGTFNQSRPLIAAVKWKQLFSLDLSAATDRLPISLQERILSDLFGSAFSAAWRSLLIARAYLLPATKATLHYAVGQPMGALSSWCMLAYTHHFIVQCAAWRVGYPLAKLFKDYAILGDDVVIGSKRVAKEYLRILKLLGVECGLHKSILSPKGLGLEFAKMTFFKGHNVTGIPFKEFSEAALTLSSAFAFMNKYKLSLATFCKGFGFGYKVLGGLNKPIHKLNSRVRAIKLLSFVTESYSKFFVPSKSNIDPLLIRKFVNLEFKALTVLVKRLMNLFADDPVLKYNGTNLRHPTYHKRIGQLDISEICKDLHLFVFHDLTIDMEFKLLVCWDRLRRFAKFSNLEESMKLILLVRRMLGTSNPKTLWTLVGNQAPNLRGADPIQIQIWKRWSGVFNKTRLEPVIRARESGFGLPIRALGNLLRRCRLIDLPPFLPKGLRRKSGLSLILSVMVYDWVFSAISTLLVGWLISLIPTVITYLWVVLSGVFLYLQSSLHWQITLNLLPTWWDYLPTVQGIGLFLIGTVIMQALIFVYTDWDLICMAARLFNERVEATTIREFIIEWSGFIWSVGKDVIYQPMVEHVIIPWANVDFLYWIQIISTDGVSWFQSTSLALLELSFALLVLPLQGLWILLPFSHTWFQHMLEQGLIELLMFMLGF